ncbi:MAG: hypothetical protein IV100_10135 [Myxococcales bacterium]|nr:hypothetical protein [Myxococcales bacterium]
MKPPPPPLQPDRSSVLRIVSARHVAEYVHLLAHFDLGKEPANVFNPHYVQRARARRAGPTVPPAMMSPTRHYGAFHRAYRAATGRATLPLLPIAAETPAGFVAIAEGLLNDTAPPDLPSGTRRALAPLSDAAGKKLVRVLMGLMEGEAREFFDAHWLSGVTVLGDDASGMDSYLGEHLVPLISPIFAGVPQHLALFPAEAIGARCWSLQPDVGVHHVAVSPVLKTAYYQVLLALMKARTDRLLRPFIPEPLKARPDDPIAQQMRTDAAMTALYHFMQRFRGERVDELRAWILRQFENTQRLPTAALEALQPMALVPEEARPAVQAMLSSIPLVAPAPGTRGGLV